MRHLGLQRCVRIAAREGYRLFEKDGAGKQGRGSRCMQRSDSNACSFALGGDDELAESLCVRIRGWKDSIVVHVC